MVFAALTLAAAVATAKPIAAPPVFVSSIHAATFEAPPGTWICQLASDWVGSDHGTVVFLVPPTACEGTGYPSTARGITDPGPVPNVEIFYAYEMPDIHAPKMCRRVARLMLLGKLHPVCREVTNGTIMLSTRATFLGDEKMELHLDLTTTPARLGGDLAVFRTIAASFRGCRSLWPADGTIKAQWVGAGRKCPRNGRYF